MTLGRGLLLAAAACGAFVGIAPGLVQSAASQVAGPDARHVGLEWTFVRIRYHYISEDARVPLPVQDEPWFIDAPAAEENLSRRLKTVTSIVAHDPVVLRLDDPKLFVYPWIYIVEPGTLKMTDADVAALREFLLRGGTVTFDDFHGPAEWDNFEAEMKRVFPDRKIVEIKPPHPVFSAFYKIDEYPQIPGLGSFWAGRTWEKGGYVAHLRAILDDDGRPMAFINWNTDMGDGMEWSNATEYPGYIAHTARAYRMMINEILFTLTH